MKLNILYIQEHLNEKSLKYFANFLYLKSLYSNSCIYNYTEQSFADKVGGSRSKWRKYVKYFIKQGWCRFHNKNLVFNKLKNIDTVKKKVIEEITNTLSPQVILDQLYHFALKVKQTQFNRFKKTNRDFLTPTNSKAYKSAKKAIRKHNITVQSNLSEGDRLKLSMVSIGDLFSCSPSKACTIIKRLERNDKIKVYKEPKMFLKVTDKRMINSAIESGVFTYVKGNYLFKNPCNRYEF